MKCRYGGHGRYSRHCSHCRHGRHGRHGRQGRHGRHGRHNTTSCVSTIIYHLCNFIPTWRHANSNLLLSTIVQNIVQYSLTILKFQEVRNKLIIILCILLWNTLKNI